MCVVVLWRYFRLTAFPANENVRLLLLQANNRISGFIATNRWENVLERPVWSFDIYWSLLFSRFWSGVPSLVKTTLWQWHVFCYRHIFLFFFLIRNLSIKPFSWQTSLISHTRKCVGVFNSINCWISCIPDLTLTVKMKHFMFLF